jgi:uncharacterized protein YjbI with pentapeptide repeats
MCLLFSLPADAESPSQSLILLKKGQTQPLHGVPAAAEQVPSASEKDDIGALTKKSESGDIDAQAELGLRYYKGRGVPQDAARAIEWWTKASIGGSVQAQNNLGALYYFGKDVRQDYTEAKKWWRLAAGQGLAVAQSSLGDMYLLGKGVAKNPAEAAKWYTIAANQGHAGSQHNLAILYSKGLGVPQNFEEAYFWSRLANHPQSVGSSDKELRGNLSPDRIAAMDQRVQKWIDDHDAAANAPVAGVLPGKGIAIRVSSLVSSLGEQPRAQFIGTPQELFKMMATRSDDGKGHSLTEPKVVNGKAIYQPDNAANIARYRKLASEMPEKSGSRTLAILADVMEKGNLQTEFVDGGEIKPLGFDGETYSVYYADNNFQCGPATWLAGFGMLPTFIFGNGLKIHCMSGEHYIITGDKDDDVEIDDNFGLNILNLGGGTDHFKLGRGQDVILLEKNWGHKNIEKKCEGREHIDRKFSVETNNINQFSGIGISFNKVPSGAQVKSILYTSFARRAGMDAGDVIQRVNGNDISPLSAQDVMNLLSGDAGTSINLTWQKADGVVKTADIERKIIRTPRVAWLATETGPQQYESEYKFPDKYYNYLVFGHGISPSEVTEVSPGHWVNAKGGDTIDMPECFNFVFADETPQQAAARKGKREIELAERLTEIRSQYPLTPPSGQTPRQDAPTVPCEDIPNTPEAIIKRFPIVVTGTLNQNADFQQKTIYKGFRSWPIQFENGSFSNMEYPPDKQVLVLADFKHSKATIRNCGKVLSESDNLNGVSFASLLAEAAVYGASASLKMTHVPTEKDYNLDRTRNASLGFLKEHADYLYILEYSTDMLRHTVDDPQYEKKPSVYYSFEDRRAQCGKQVEAEGSEFNGDMKGTILKAYTMLGTSSGGPGPGYFAPINFALGNIGNAFLKVGEYRAALFTLCGLGNSDSYFAAILGAKRADLLNGAVMENLRSLDGIDLSGLVLRKATVSGEWHNVKVDGADFTNANFKDAKFFNVNLDKANLAFATYSCKTQFPDGFDPVVHHMVPQWRFQECDDKPIPKVNLKGLRVTPHHIEPDPSTQIESVDYMVPGAVGALRHHANPRADAKEREYNEMELRNVELDGVQAQNSMLGRIRCGACIIKNADFSGAQLSFWQGGSGAAQISDTSFKGADLKGSDINTASFTNVDFSNADLSDVNMKNTRLIAVNFSNAKLDSQKFAHARYDTKTIFPAGFDPRAAGMLMFTDMGK